jgi:hypothetical protein
VGYKTQTENQKKELEPIARRFKPTLRRGEGRATISISKIKKQTCNPPWPREMGLQSNTIKKIL